ncbi:MAG: sugar transferase [Terriglobia bacterium]
MLVGQYFWPEKIGAGLWLHQLATDLAANGHQVSMVTAFPHYPEGRVFPGYRRAVFRREVVSGVEVVRTFIYATPSKSFWPRVLSFGTFCASAPLGCFGMQRPEVIYCIIPPLPLAWTTELVGLARRVPVVVNVQDIYPDLAVSLGYLRNRLAIRFFQWMERFIYEHAAGVVVITDSFRDNLIAKGVPARKIHVVPNWADSHEIEPGPKQNSFRRELGMNHEFTVVYSGSLGHNTCLETVVEAARILAAEPFRFLLVGDGIHKQALENLAKKYRLTNLSFLPFQPLEVYPQVLAASDVQLVTLNSTASAISLPSKIFKIMASGRPLLALTRPESDLCRLLAGGRCGICVDPKDPQGLAAALRRLAGDRGALETMGTNARRFLLENFARSRCVSQLESILVSAAQARRRPVSRAGLPSAGESPRKRRWRRDFRGCQWKTKRVVEWLMALGFLVATLPLQLLIAVAIKLDSPGPVLLGQDRLGRDGKTFNMYKFRTLRWEPDSLPVLNFDGSTRVEKDDARLTRMGGWLRAGWDELPQLLNVLKGEMALIGPRPDEPFHRRYYSQQEQQKLAVLPGITGLPQASGRNRISWKGRIALDLNYIENYSMWLDVKIALRTAWAVLRGRGAYARENFTTQIQ